MVERDSAVERAVAVLGRGSCSGCCNAFFGDLAEGSVLEITLGERRRSKRRVKCMRDPRAQGKRRREKEERFRTSARSEGKSEILRHFATRREWREM